MSKIWAVIKQRLKSKTYWAALIMAVLGSIEASQGYVSGLLPLRWQPFTILLFPVVMMVMREFTTAALADK